MITSCKKNKEKKEKEVVVSEPIKNDKVKKPKIVNIINFIRLLEPRDPAITEDVLYQTVVKQIDIMNTYKLPGSFLLQYDALMNSRYQKLLKELPKDTFDIGAWWEIPQPLVEKAGLKWRGRYPWDWHANVGFTTGYTPEEREKLADVYMSDFKKIFGSYPKSVASWFIDAHTLNYLYTKYKIEASAICRDQYGTDGYTLWGGYWNQGYYPSKVNTYMPAQNKENQIPVPVFRLLGSDPIRQYEQKIGDNGQSVMTLETVYENAGGNAKWVNWYFDQFVNGEPMEFAYVQAGQENSFTWDLMKNGYEIQIPLIAKLRDEKKVETKTLAATGKWFKEKYAVTPATSVTVTKDLEDGNRRTVWFNSRYYRVNLLWEDETLRFRDIHLFNEKIPSAYVDKKVNSTACNFFTLPFVDGFLWSDDTTIAGLRFKALVNGKETILKGQDPVITNPEKGKLQITWGLKNHDGTFVINIDEKVLKIEYKDNTELNWFLDLTTAKDAKLPFVKIEEKQLTNEFESSPYSVKLNQGSASKPNEHTIFRITPEKSNIIINLFSR